MNALAGLLLVVGVALIVSGTAMVSVPVALIVGGGLVVAVGVGFLETSR